jgi:hypothetical protein
VEAFPALVAALHAERARFVLIGVWAANLHARSAATLVMEGFAFEEVWAERRVYLLEGVEVPVARLSHVVRSKAAVGRPKDLLFLATHEEALRDLLKRED